MLKRFDGTNWVEPTTPIKRFDGANWIEVETIKRFDGTSWIEVYQKSVTQADLTNS